MVSRRPGARAAAALGAALCAVVSITGCGLAGAASPRPGNLAADQARPHAQAIHVSLRSVPVLPLLTASKAARLKPQPWTLTAIRDHGRQLVLYLPFVMCYGAPLGATVRQTGRAITIAVLARAENGFCTAIGGGQFGAIQLPKPVGAQAIRHGR
jgi:hypothetical protein